MSNVENHQMLFLYQFQKGSRNECVLVVVAEDGLENQFPRHEVPSMQLNVHNINLLSSPMDILIH